MAADNFKSGTFWGKSVENRCILGSFMITSADKSEKMQEYFSGYMSTKQNMDLRMPCTVRDVKGIYGKSIAG